ncbi:peroxiredoxin family protein [Kordiimonas sp. SCSIO 12603]|uniref:peroxiredoxin family protein n=1 Tax=Kordiimonas sp. SCSIO 12603 TaxID=2829596 RepID=UPI0021053221|nr:peroxiredoxin family protein [Kordiimonas sp. SCSIO 12603]UTW59697.1 peroxiredoxin family protein [Kordiimonas sp. SCSIO 12603]
MFKKILSGIVLLIASSFPAAASDLGPAVGSKIPHNLEVMDQKGQQQSFSSLTGENGTVLVFFRSAKWCPYCQRQLINIEKSAAEEIRKRGFNVVGVSYDSVKVLDKFTKKRGISYPLLSDDGSAIIKSFGVLNEKYKPGDRVYGIPHPIIVITDNSGTIKAKLFEEGYKNRPETEVILSELDKL